MRTSVNPVEPSEQDRQAEQLSDRDLATVSGGKGKATLTPIVVVKHYDKASPILM
jgi:type VI protein secretion system component Hcp